MQNIEEPYVKVKLTPPSMLEQAMGYHGQNTWVAFHWNVPHCSVIYDDGHIQAPGNWHGWIAYTSHKAIAHHFPKDYFVADDPQTTRCLLLNRETREMWTLPLEVAQEMLYPRYDTNDPLRANQTFTETEVLKLGHHMASSIARITPEMIRETRENEHFLLANMVHWLDNNFH